MITENPGNTPDTQKTDNIGEITEKPVRTYFSSFKIGAINQTKKENIRLLIDKCRKLDALYTRRLERLVTKMKGMSDLFDSLNKAKPTEAAQREKLRKEYMSLMKTHDKLKELTNGNKKRLATFEAQYNEL